jgi:hypothetical protein
MATQEDFEGIDDVGDELEHARNVMFVNKNLGRKLSERRAGSAAVRIMHDWASNPENQEKWYSVIVPKAVDTLQKAKRESTDDDKIVAIERKGIDELKQILGEAIAQSQVTAGSAG